MAIFLAVNGGAFSMFTIQEGSDSKVASYFTTMIFALIVLIPLLTMKTFSEEKKLKTDQLLFTVPIRMTDIVLGKYFAALSVFVLSMLGTFMIPLILKFYSVSEPWAIFGNYVAIFFAASAFIAIGLFISSLTENQLVSALVTWAVLIGLWLVDLLVSNIEITAVKTVVGWLSVFSRYSSFTYGLFDLSDIVYYISISAVFIYLTIRMLDKKRYA